MDKLGCARLHFATKKIPYLTTAPPKQLHENNLFFKVCVDSWRCGLRLAADSPPIWSGTLSHFLRCTFILIPQSPDDRLLFGRGWRCWQCCWQGLMGPDNVITLPPSWHNINNNAKGVKVQLGAWHGMALHFHPILSLVFNYCMGDRLELCHEGRPDLKCVFAPVASARSGESGESFAPVLMRWIRFISCRLPSQVPRPTFGKLVGEPDNRLHCYWSLVSGLLTNSKQGLANQFSWAINRYIRCNQQIRWIKGNLQIWRIWMPTNICSLDRMQ